MLFNQELVPCVLIDPETGQRIAFNKKAYESLGYTESEFQNLKIDEFIINETTEGIKKHLERIVKKGSDFFEVMLRTKDGEIRDIFLNCVAVNIQGKDYLLGIRFDISEQKFALKVVGGSNSKLKRNIEAFTSKLVKTNEQLTKEIKDGTLMKAVLRESEEEFRSFVETASDFMFILNKSSKITYANRSI